MNDLEKLVTQTISIYTDQSDDGAKTKRMRTHVTMTAALQPESFAKHIRNVNSNKWLQIGFKFNQFDIETFTAYIRIFTTNTHISFELCAFYAANIENIGFSGFTANVLMVPWPNPFRLVNLPFFRCRSYNDIFDFEYTITKTWNGLCKSDASWC